MSKYLKDKNVESVYYIKNGKRYRVVETYIGRKLIWAINMVRSCFGGGSWRNDLPWNNDDGWKN